MHHDGRGYVSLDGAPIAVSTEIQEGKWDLIDPFYRDRTQRGPVFKCWFGHDPARTGGYAYAFLPCCDAKRTERFAGNPSVRILRNDAGCQAVEYGKICCAVVHRAGEYRLGGRTITAPEPAIYLLRGGRTEVRQPSAPKRRCRLNAGRPEKAPLFYISADLFRSGANFGSLLNMHLVLAL